MVKEHITGHPITKREGEEALRIARNIVGASAVQHYSPSAAEYKLADALISSSAVVQGMRDALEKIAEPMGSLQSWERGAHRRDIALKALAALSALAGEDEQATRGEDAATASTDR